MVRARAWISQITDLIMTQGHFSCSPPSAHPFLLTLSGCGGISQSNHPSSIRQNIFFNRAKEYDLCREDDSMWPEGPILSISSFLNEKVSIIVVVFFSVASSWFFALPVTTIFLPSRLPNFLHLPTSLGSMLPVRVFFWWLATGYRYLRGSAHSMGLQHSHRSGLWNCCKARRQTCFDCQAAALVRDNRRHTAQAESVTLSLTSLFQIRAKKAGWLKHRSAPA